MASFSPGTGAQFALIPPENATGNFTKIVQRVPVRIRFKAGAEARKVLVPGLSVVVSVDTRRRTGRGGGRGTGRGAGRAGRPRRTGRPFPLGGRKAMSGHPTPPAKADAAAWLAVAAGTIGALMATLDTSIVNAALPTIQGEIGASGSEGTWISTAYLVAEIIIIPLTGWLERVFGLRNFLVACTILFVGFSCFAGWRPIST